jgi:hypothetical protein
MSREDTAKLCQDAAIALANDVPLELTQRAGDEWPNSFVMLADSKIAPVGGSKE